MYINRLNDYYKSTFGDKIYKLSLDGGFTCPNRDGTIDTRGCIFCSAGGSGDFASSRTLSITEQIEEGKKLVSKKIKNGKYIAYFQAYTNTYADVSYLRKIYTEAMMHPDIVAISIATRPDCIDQNIAALLYELNEIKPIYIELGLQTSNESTAAFIRRGYPNKTFEYAIELIKDLNIVVHIILGLPFESIDDMVSSVRYINQFPINGVKLQLLHILHGTDLYNYYQKNPFKVLELEEYTDILCRCVTNLRRDIVIHRLTGDGPKKLLFAPTFSSDKKRVLNYINNQFSCRDIEQGSAL